MTRALPVLSAAALAALVLVGCAADPGESDPTATADTSTERECAPSGDASAAVDVTGEFGVEPVVTIAAPIDPTTTERQLVIEGGGAEVVYGDTVTLDVAIYSGTTGELATLLGYGEDQKLEIAVDEASFIPGIVKTVECSTVGSRVIGAVPASEAFGDNGLSGTEIAAGEPVVFVVDVLAVQEPLTPAVWTDGVPEVTRDADGIPTVTLASATPATELIEAVLVEGDGAVVESGASVTVDYQGISWDTGEIFDQSFGTSPATFSTDGVVDGFAAALIGQKVGSTVIVSIPPQYAYGTDPDAHQLGGQTLVFLIDIIAVV